MWKVKIFCFPYHLCVVGIPPRGNYMLPISFIFYHHAGMQVVWKGSISEE